MGMMDSMPLRSDSTTWFGVVLGAPDARALADFYARLLGWQVFADVGDDNFFSVAPDETSGYNLACQYEEHHVRPAWPAGPGDPQMQAHLDFQVDDLDQAVAFAVECGAELAGFQPQERVRVMLDPAGHPFCLYL
jgi:catechol 2,3-dioxygenase-like lactoylglutathione lyase family enzyme